MDVANYALAHYLARTGRAVSLVAHRVDADLAALPGVSFEKVSKPLNSYLLAAPLLRRRGLAVGGSVLRAGGDAVANGGNCPLPAVNWVHYVHAAYAPHGAGSFLRRGKQAFARWCHLREERIAFRAARRLIANSYRTKDDLVRGFKINPSLIDVIYYGVDAERFAPATDEQRRDVRQRLGWNAYCCGDARKGFDTLFAAWPGVAASGVRAKLVVIGQGAELSDWQRRSSVAGISGSIEFMGFRADVHEILRACDALVSPTRYEAYGLGVHEAICVGIPAVVSSTAGVAERYPAGFDELLLSDPENPTDLAARVVSCLANHQLWREKMIAFSGQLRKRTWDDMARDILRVLACPRSETGLSC